MCNSVIEKNEDKFETLLRLMVQLAKRLSHADHGEEITVELNHQCQELIMLMRNSIKTHDKNLILDDQTILLMYDALRERFFSENSKPKLGPINLDPSVIKSSLSPRLKASEFKFDYDDVGQSVALSKDLMKQFLEFVRDPQTKHSKKI